MADAKKTRIKVFVRLRPPLPDELTQPGYEIAVSCDPANAEVKIDKSIDKKNYVFDGVFHSKVTQQEVFDAVARPIVDDSLDGIFGTCFAYGQSGTGKTHTLSNMDSTDPEEYGIIPRSIRYLFQRVAEEKVANPQVEFTVRISYVQIYLEMIEDLLCPGASNLQIREDPDSGVFIKGVTEAPVTSWDDCYRLIQEGDSNRVVALTKLNASSSRSHACLIVKIEKRTKITRQTQESDNFGDGTVVYGKLTLVDLAGSERMKKTGASGKQADEAKAINLSLSALGNVISALTDPKGGHVPFRDSKLTRLLQDSLGGNGKTSIIVTLRPDKAQLQESTSTILFGQRAMKVVSTVRKNQDVDYRALSTKLQAQVDMLNDEIARIKLEKSGQASIEETEQLQAVLGEHQAEVMRFKEQLEQLERQMEQAEVEHTERTTELVSTNSNLFDEVAQYTAKIDELTSENAQWKEKLQEANAEKQWADARRDALESQLRQHLGQISTLEKRLESTQADMTARIVELTSRNIQMNEELASMREMLDVVETEKDHMQQQATELSIKYHDALAESQTLRKNLEDVVAECSSLTQQSDALRDAKREQNKQLMQVKASLREVESSADSMKQRIATLEGEIAREREEKSRMQMDLVTARDLVQSISGISNSGNGNSDNGGSTSGSSARSGSTSAASGESLNLASKVRDMMNSVTDLQTKVVEFQKQADASRLENNSLQKRVRDLEAELQGKTAEQERVVSMLQSVDRHVQSLGLDQLSSACKLLHSHNDSPLLSTKWRQRLSCLSEPYAIQQSAGNDDDSLLVSLVNGDSVGQRIKRSSHTPALHCREIVDSVLDNVMSFAQPASMIADLHVSLEEAKSIAADEMTGRLSLADVSSSLSQWKSVPARCSDWRWDPESSYEESVLAVANNGWVSFASHAFSLINSLSFALLDFELLFSVMYESVKRDEVAYALAFDMLHRSIDVTERFRRWNHSDRSLLTSYQHSLRVHGAQNRELRSEVALLRAKLLDVEIERDSNKRKLLKEAQSLQAQNQMLGDATAHTGMYLMEKSFSEVMEIFRVLTGFFLSENSPSFDRFERMMDDRDRKESEQAAKEKEQKDSNRKSLARSVSTTSVASAAASFNAPILEEDDDDEVEVANPLMMMRQ